MFHIPVHVTFKDISANSCIFSVDDYCDNLTLAWCKAMRIYNKLRLEANTDAETHDSYIASDKNVPAVSYFFAFGLDKVRLQLVLPFYRHIH